MLVEDNAGRHVDVTRDQYRFIVQATSPNDPAMRFQQDGRKFMRKGLQ